MNSNHSWCFWADTSGHSSRLLYLGVPKAAPRSEGIGDTFVQYRGTVFGAIVPAERRTTQPVNASIEGARAAMRTKATRVAEPEAGMSVHKTGFITGASQGIGAGLVYGRQHPAVAMRAPNLA